MCFSIFSKLSHFWLDFVKSPKKLSRHLRRLKTDEVTFGIGSNASFGTVKSICISPRLCASTDRAQNSLSPLLAQNLSATSFCVITTNPLQSGSFSAIRIMRVAI